MESHIRVGVGGVAPLSKESPTNNSKDVNDACHHYTPRYEKNIMHKNSVFGYVRDG